MKTLFWRGSLIIFLSLLFSISFKAQDKVVDSLKLALKSAKQDTVKAYILSQLAESASDEEWPAFNAQMVNLCEDKLKNVAVGSPEYKTFSRLLASGYNNNAVIAQNAGEYNKAIEQLNKAYKLEEQVEYKEGMAHSLNSLGAIYQRKGDFINAMEHYKRSEKLNTEVGNMKGVILSLNQMGGILKGQGDVIKGISYFEKALALAEKHNEKEGISTALYNLALVFATQGEPSKAKEYGLKALKEVEATRDKVYLSYIVSFLGGIYLKEGDSKKAIEYYERSLKLREEQGDQRSIAMSYQSLGGAYSYLGKYDLAMDYYSKSLKISETTGDKLNIGNSYGNIGALYLKMGNTNKAFENFIKYLKIAQEVKHLEIIKDAASKLQGIYKQRGDFKNAYEMYNLYITTRDSIDSKENKKAVIRSQFSIEFNQKEQDLKNEQEKKDLLYEQEKIKKQADLDKQKAISYGFMIGAVLLLALIYVVFSNLRQSKAKNKIITEQKKAVEQQKELIETKQKEIVDSINYARRIQNTLLAHNEFLNNYLPQHFVYFKPKDIVSGDFYWATRKDNYFYFAICDSTGHGVPGAFMSLLNISFLNEAINERNILAPDEIFNHVREKLVENMAKEEQKDGFDGILIRIDLISKKISYAAANNKPILVSASQLNELQADKMPVGLGVRNEAFKLYNVEAPQGSILYLYTDGYADQFGGEKGKKFKYKKLNELILANANKPMKEQKELLGMTFEQWRGNLEQIDDVCVVGIKI